MTFSFSPFSWAPIFFLYFFFFLQSFYVFCLDEESLLFFSLTVVFFTVVFVVRKRFDSEISAYVEELKHTLRSGFHRNANFLLNQKQRHNFVFGAHFFSNSWLLSFLDFFERNLGRRFFSCQSRLFSDIGASISQYVSAALYHRSYVCDCLYSLFSEVTLDELTSLDGSSPEEDSVFRLHGYLLGPMRPNCYDE